MRRSPDRYPMRNPGRMLRIEAMPGVVVFIDPHLAQLVDMQDAEPTTSTSRTYTRREQPAAEAIADLTEAGAFVHAECEHVVGARVGARVLFDAYQAWTRAQGSEGMGIKRFRKALIAHCFAQITSDGVKWVGIRLRAAPVAEQNDLLSGVETVVRFRDAKGGGGRTKI